MIQAWKLSFPHPEYMLYPNSRHRVGMVIGQLCVVFGVRVWCHHVGSLGIPRVPNKVAMVAVI